MIAICPNPFRDTELIITRQAMRLLEDAGFETVVCPVFADEEPEVIPADIPTKKLEEAGPECSMILVIGGDGTILSVARTLHDAAIPMLGINLGTKGFMAYLEPEELDYIVAAAKGECKISSRMLLHVELVRDGQVIHRDQALNDVVLHGYGDVIQTTAFCNGDKITSISGDGIILATPTGSTGYSMSAGGPIVEPDAENILISPICAHTLGARSFVLDPQRRVSVLAEKLHGRRAYLSVDGYSVADLANGDIVNVCRSEHKLLMIDPGLRSFFENTYQKLR
jgi:NAD+ kinase